MGQVDDVATCVTMDLKTPGNLLYQIGLTKDELGGSHWTLVSETSGGNVPQVDIDGAIATYEATHAAIKSGLIRSCHDISEGGLAAAVAEMAFAGGCGAEVDIAAIEVEGSNADLLRLFAESNSRFVVEVTPENQAAFEAAFDGVAITALGKVTEGDSVTIANGDMTLISETLTKLKSSWQKPLDLA